MAFHMHERHSVAELLDAEKAGATFIEQMFIVERLLTDDYRRNIRKLDDWINRHAGEVVELSGILQALDRAGIAVKPKGAKRYA